MDRVRASGLDFEEAVLLRKHLNTAVDWGNRAQAALLGSVPLRELERLLAEAEKLAVDPGPKLPELQAKMAKAQAWLDKVRKVVPKQRATRRNATDVETEKVTSASRCRPLMLSSTSIHAGDATLRCACPV